jgi:bleomycin hydrolase
MKRFALLLLLACNNALEKASPPPRSDLTFTPVMDLPTLPVGDQAHSGTCWSFATTSLLESEIIRLKGEQVDLSEMYFVRCAYIQKAQNYILRQGSARFTEGGLSHDPILSAMQFGMLPQSAYNGLLHGATAHDHAPVMHVLENAVKQQGPVWKTTIPAILDSCLGKVPASFEYAGKTYTPGSFMAYTQLNPVDYITITSFSHVPFYKPFVLSIPANWANERFYNLPLEEFMANIDHALDAGFTLSLDLDGTEKTFLVEEGIGTWPDSTITQQMRQDAFEHFTTTDDHLMHISGKVKDQYGHIFYKCKNSWGATAGKQGFMYLSIPFMKMKAISVLLHKDGLLNDTRHMINLQP